MENRRITSNELAERLVSSRKIMEKVDSGDFESGTINKKLIINDPNEFLSENENSEFLPYNPSKIQKWDTTVDKINNTKLPDSIKRAMIDNPIPQIELNESLDINFVKKARKLMEQDGVLPKKSSLESSNIKTISSSELEKRLTPIIENVIRKTLDDIVDKKLEQILMAQNAVTINENLIIKVGKTTFAGKITKSKSS